MYSNDMIKKLLESSLDSDILLGLEFQYQNFKKGYVNWYKRDKYAREYIKRIGNNMGVNRDDYKDVENRYININGIRIYDWFINRLKEDLI